MSAGDIIQLTGSVSENATNKGGIVKHPYQANDTLIHPLDENMATNDYLRTSSIDIENALNFKNLEERARYNDWLIGRGLRSELGHEQNYADGTAIDNDHSRPPSWTQTDAKLNHAFVISALSSSEHELSHYKAYNSGSRAIESTAVSATGTLYYTKKPKQYFKAVYKMSGSDTMMADADHMSDTFDTNLGLQFSASFGKVAKFTLNVPDRGRIADIRVWVEFMHNSGTYSSGADTEWTGDSFPAPLSSFVLAMRSPDPSLGDFFSFPILNDFRLKNAARGLSEYAPTNFQDGNETAEQPAISTIFRRSFLLWVGRSGSTAAEKFETNMSSWGRDRHIRTVFHDGSTQHNPCTIDAFYADGAPSNDWATEGATGAPNADTGFGNDYPWTTDVDDWYVNVEADLSGAGSPPDGWLTGGGGVADVNEWPTTGSNYGPADMMPYYPMLDAIEEVQDTIAIKEEARPPIRGRRPGLRGTQMQGDWEFLVVTSPYSKGGIVLYDSSTVLAFFRQIRLEITYEADSTYYGDLATRSRRYKFSSHGYFKSSDLLARRVSGSSPQAALGVDFNNDTRINASVLNNLGLANNKENKVYYVQERPHGMTAGIIEETGSINSDFAVFTRITGSLADRLSGSDHASTRYAFLNNEFGTPLIPLSSGSGEPAELQFFIKSDIEANKKLISDIFTPRANVDPSLTLKALLSKKSGVTLLSKDIALQKTSGSV